MAFKVNSAEFRMLIGIIALKDRSLTPPVQLFIDRLRERALPLSAS